MKDFRIEISTFVDSQKLGDRIIDINRYTFFRIWINTENRLQITI